MMKGIKVAVAISLFLGITTPAKAEMFGYGEVQHQDIKEFTKWESVLNKFQSEVSSNNAGLNKFQNGLKKIASMKSGPDKIRAVNDFVNMSISYNPDSMVWGRSDYWAAPGETFTKGEGDCDDYAIAKFFALRMLGFRDNDMRIVILRDNRKNEIHAVLAVNYGGSNYILDNQSEYVVQDTQISYYKPIYSLSETNYWTHS